MKAYIGTKKVLAKHMTRAEYNEYRGWELPQEENGDDKGMLVEYENGGKSNHENHKGYISWSPIDVFESSYKIAETFKDRVVIELHNLTSMISKLEAALEKNTIPRNHIFDLKSQLLAMNEYRDILVKRLNDRCHGMPFGLAIEAMKRGSRLYREGWNGKGMFVCLQDGSTIKPSQARGGACAAIANDKSIDIDWIVINPHFSIRNVDNSVSTWVPSINDCLAEAWMIIND